MPFSPRAMAALVALQAERSLPRARPACMFFEPEPNLNRVQESSAAPCARVSFDKCGRYRRAHSGAIHSFWGTLLGLQAFIARCQSVARAVIQRLAPSALAIAIGRRKAAVALTPGVRNAKIDAFSIDRHQGPRRVCTSRRLAAATQPSGEVTTRRSGPPPHPSFPLRAAF